MVTKRILQKALFDMRGIIGAHLSLWDMTGHCVASTDDVTEIEEDKVANYLYMDAEQECGCSEDGEESCYMFNISEDGDACYILVIRGEIGEPELIGNLCVCQLESLIIAYQERLTKHTFMQQLLLGDIVEGEICNKASKLQVPIDVRRVVYVIEPKQKHDPVLVDVLKSLCGTEIYDYIITTEDGNVVLIKQLQVTDEEVVVHKMAKVIVDTLNAEAMIQVRVAYGSVLIPIKEIVKSYKEALMALEVGSEFYPTKAVLSYTKLGIGRLIYQLPTTICDVFLEEVLRGQAMASFDEETMKIVHHFFENNLNISETSRQLYIHRNTLGYRLDKIQKATGLDIRGFEDAMTFKVAMMVSEHVTCKMYKNSL